MLYNELLSLVEFIWGNKFGLHHHVLGWSVLEFIAMWHFFLKSVLKPDAFFGLLLDRHITGDGGGGP